MMMMMILFNTESCSARQTARVTSTAHGTHGGDAKSFSISTGILFGNLILTGLLRLNRTDAFSLARGQFPAAQRE
jgi:hypothetical protein